MLSQSFRIDGANRDQLYLLEPLDFERTPSISVHIRVTDSGGLHFDNVFTITVQGLLEFVTKLRSLTSFGSYQF